MKKKIIDANATYHDKHISTMQTCRLKKSHHHKNLLSDIYDIKINSFEYVKNVVCFSNNNDAVIENKKQNIIWFELPNIFQCKMLYVT